MGSSIKAIYDYLVIGGGSGGVSSARKAASYGAKTAVIEFYKLGGTCVNFGCIPKKIMWNASNVAENFHLAKDYGFSANPLNFSWKTLKERRDRHITKLNQIYGNLLERSNVDYINGMARFISSNVVQVGSDLYEGKHILIATGSKPAIPNIPGTQLAINSDDFFNLVEQPKKVAVFGAGYIAVEMCGMLGLLGSETYLFIRTDKILRNFDSSVTEFVQNQLENSVKIVTNAIAKELKRSEDGRIDCYLESGQVYHGFDAILWAIGRVPDVENLDLEKVSIQVNKSNYVVVNDYQETNVKNVYAIGDVTGKIQLTPVAIAAGRRLSRRLFNNETNLKMDYENVPTVVFSHPPIGTIGLTERQAIEAYDKKTLKVYTSTFVNTLYAVSDENPKSFVKMICQGPDERVIGLHIVGMGADEMLQGFSVAIKMGAKKSDFDNTISIHPTAAEEVVTLTNFYSPGD